MAAALLDAGVPREHVCAATEAFKTWLTQDHFPIYAGAVCDQTASARRWAVALEQENAEHIRRTTIALALLDETVCGCRPPIRCIKHQLEDLFRAEWPR
jgi:hypothetical protein